jgi:2-methylcitrate dehydratase PrpD
MVAPLFALAEERGASGLRIVLAYVAGIEAGLDPPRMATALALAASMASGLKASFGTMAKPFHVGHCARNGLLGALMARPPGHLTPVGAPGPEHPPRSRGSEMPTRE